ncbi:MAG: hypothetical protein RLZZ597_3215, partial [Cyanobacteriota bacterium]
YVVVEVLLQFPQEQRVQRVSLRRFINIATSLKSVNTLIKLFSEGRNSLRIKEFPRSDGG